MNKFSDQQIIPIESIQERDIDLILLEELSTDHSFCEQFVSALNLPEYSSSNGAWRSISDFGLGETDLLFSYNSIDKTIFVLIENKLDATFQFEQFIRYENRAHEYLQKEYCDAAYCVLIAPKVYCENQIDFEKFIAYEKIAELFDQQNTQRGTFKSQLLKIGIEKSRRGYYPVNSEPVQRFWQLYWEYKNINLPELTMKKPTIVPHNSDWPMLYDDHLKGIIFYHKLAQGNVDATFTGYSADFIIQLKAILPPEFLFVSHSKSFSIRIVSEKIDRTRTFNEQISEVDIGLKNIEKLRLWLNNNRISN